MSEVTEEMKEDSAEDAVNQKDDGSSECQSGCEGASESDENESNDGALDDEVSLLKKENAELKDQLLRRAADFDNYRKRMLKEKQDTFDFANENLLRDLLESLDNFDRTVEAASNAKDATSIADGIKMINGSLVKMLEDKYNLSSYGVAGEPFNSDEHEAIGSMQGDVTEPVLKEVYLKGYKLKDKIIRHAKVMVLMPGKSAKGEVAKGEVAKGESGKSAE